MSQQRRLTKSDFVRFIDCKNEFWLDAHFPEPAGELSLLDQHKRQFGYDVEGLARTHPKFSEPDGVAIEFAKTFQTEKAFAKSDIVATDLATNEIEIYEVKSGTSSKEEYKLDLAFQCVVARAAGYNLRAAHLITVDSSYVLDGELDVTRLLRITDETEYVNEIGETITAQIDTALAWLESPEPEVNLVDYCKGAKLACRYLVRNFPDIPEYNVGHLFNAGSNKLNALLEQSILNICDIPADFDMTEREARLVAMERCGEPNIKDKEAITAELAALRYPLCFLDYESFGYPIPKFQGTFAWQQMPFQYSLHVIDSPGGETRHSYFLSRNDGRLPAEEMLESLHGDLSGRMGTVIVWSESFETGINDKLAVMFPAYADFLAELNANVYDLRKIFSQRRYMHPAFHGRDSIKNVLPVLCPDLSYDAMDIGDGMTASILWYHMATRNYDAAEREKIYDDLCAYCHLDTLAMVRIFEFLKDGEKSPKSQKSQVPG